MRILIPRPTAYGVTSIEVAPHDAEFERVPVPDAVAGPILIAE